MPESPDPVRAAFGPLRQTTAVSPEDVARVRLAAHAPRRTRTRVVVGLGAAMTVLAASAASVVLVDRGHPGTFVGQAGARELLRAAAAAARDDRAPRGWRLRTTVRVERQAFEGRRCATCSTDDAVLETTADERLWSGPRGETYTLYGQRTPRAIENAPLLRYVGALDPPKAGSVVNGAHVVPAGGGDTGSDLVGRPGTIADPSIVPDRPEALLRWAARRQRAAWRQQKQQAARQGGMIGSAISMTTRISYSLIDLATAPELSGRQHAAAFEALADRPDVTAVPAPKAFASAGRVAIRIAAVAGKHGAEEMRAMPVADRVIVFDRTTHRVVAEAAQPTREDPRAIFQFGTGRHRRSLRLVAGGGGETRYGSPVDVAGPGLDTDGRRILDLGDVLEDNNRDGTLTQSSLRRLTRRSAAGASEVARKRRGR